MKTKILFATLCLLMPVMANAEIIYHVEQVEMPRIKSNTGIDNHALSDMRHYYVGASYNYTMWQDYTNDINISLNGKNTSSFDIVAGLRLYDTFRLEANYINTTAKWNTFSFDSNMAMLNMIWDARIDSIYRIFNTQMLVPYVGFGAGAAWNNANNNNEMEHKISPVVSVMAGIGVEFNDIFALDFGYKYVYMFDGDNNIVSDFTPTAHQFRAGARIHF